MTDLLIENAALLDLADGRRHEHSPVRIEGQRIVEVSHGCTLDARDNIARPDADGRSPLSGLIDAHVHARHPPDRSHGWRRSGGRDHPGRRSRAALDRARRPPQRDRRRRHGRAQRFLVPTLVVYEQDPVRLNSDSRSIRYTRPTTALILCSMTTHVYDLSHDLHPGMHTHPGLPGSEHEPYRTRQEYQEASGTSFQIDRICMVGNTGTYLDSPFHRSADGGDLASVPLSQVVNIPAVVVDARGERRVGTDTVRHGIGDENITGSAVLLYTGGDADWGEDEYALDAPYVTDAAADWLTQRRPSLVGIDSVNIDDLADPSRPVHTRLLGNNTLIVEHLTGLGAIPARGAQLHAAPLARHGVGTWPVRTYATVSQ